MSSGVNWLRTIKTHQRLKSALKACYANVISSGIDHGEKFNSLILITVKVLKYGELVHVAVGSTQKHAHGWGRDVMLMVYLQGTISY